MEHGLEFLYETIAILLFVLAISFIFTIFQSLDQIELEAKQNIYDQHVLYINSSFE
jgi:hypothetical protein